MSQHNAAVEEWINEVNAATGSCIYAIPDGTGKIEVWDYDSFLGITEKWSDVPNVVTGYEQNFKDSIIKHDTFCIEDVPF